MRAHSTRRTSPRLRRLLRRAIVIAGVLMVAAVQAHAVPLTGAEFSIVLDESSPDVIPHVADGTFIIGAPDPGKCANCFDINNMDIIVVSNGPPAVVIASDALFFDSLTSELGGAQAFVTTGGGGGLHHVTLTLTDGTHNWSLVDIKDATGEERDFNGTYSLTRVVPEPSSLLLLGAALVGLAPVAWRRHRDLRRKIRPFRG